MTIFLKKVPSNIFGSILHTLLYNFHIKCIKKLIKNLSTGHQKARVIKPLDEWNPEGLSKNEHFSMELLSLYFHCQRHTLECLTTVDKDSVLFWYAYKDWIKILRFIWDRIAAKFKVLEWVHYFSLIYIHQLLTLFFLTLLNI